MPFSHHSHSGQFCSHATDSLEGMVQKAISMNMEVYCLTEHMPREAQDFYPGEVDEICQILQAEAGESWQKREVRAQDYLVDLFNRYYLEARRLQEVYKDRITLLVGMEIDWIRQSSMDWVQNLLRSYRLDLLIGSVHHVHDYAIDFDRRSYEEARGRSDDSDVRLFADYFDLQYEMLQALQPPVIGHFDLIRLKSDDSNKSLKSIDQQDPTCAMWDKLLRNLDYIGSYGGVVEINSAALRKGLAEPYPSLDVCKEILARGIRITISDDAHGLDHIAAHYQDAFAFLDRIGFQSLTYFRVGDDCFDRGFPRFPRLQSHSVKIRDLLKSHKFFHIEATKPMV